MIDLNDAFWRELADRAVTALARYVELQERRLIFEERRDVSIRAEKAARWKVDKRQPPDADSGVRRGSVDYAALREMLAKLDNHEEPDGKGGDDGEG